MIVSKSSHLSNRFAILPRKFPCASGTRSPNPRLRNRFARPLLLEYLEERLVPAQIVWDGGPAGTGTSWNDPVNWAGDVLPGASDDAQIGSAFAGITITASNNVSIASVTSAAALQVTAGTFAIAFASSQIDASLTVSGGTLRLTRATINGTGSLTNASMMELINSTVNVPLSNQGTLLAQGSSALNGSLTTVSGSTLRVEGNGITLDAFLTVASGFTNQGTIELTGQSGRAGHLTMTSGTLTNAAGATVRTVNLQGSLEAQLDNRGAVQVLAGLILGKSSATHVNSGSIAVMGGDLIINQTGTGPSFTNTGSIDIHSGRTFQVTGGTFRQDAPGSITGAGTLALAFLNGTFSTPVNVSNWTVSGSTVNYAPDFNTASTRLALSNSTWSSPGTLNNAAGKSMTVVGSTVNATLDNHGTLLAQGISALNSAFGNASGSLLRLEGNGSTGNSVLTVASGFTNLGTIELTGLVGRSAALVVTSGTLTNAVGGTIRSVSAQGVLHSVAAPLDNQGAVQVRAGLVLNKASASYANSGTISVTGGDLVVEQPLTNSGVIDVAPGGTFSINEKLTNNGAGILTGQGTFAIRFGNVQGQTSNADRFAPPGSVRVTGSGTELSPQLFEVMSQNRGNVAAGFTNNFVLGTLFFANDLLNNPHFQLTDFADNFPGADPEAIYVNTFIVAAGVTLDLNHFQVYARQMQIDSGATILGGAVSLVPDSGPIALNAPTPGGIGATGEVDEWTFFGRAGELVTVVGNPGGTGSPAPLAPMLNFGDIRLLDPSGAEIESGSSTALGQMVTLRAVALPADGTYRVQVRAGAGADRGNYVLAVWGASVDTMPVLINQQAGGTLETPFSVDRWTFTGVANQQVALDWINASPTTINFKLTGPNGFTGFSGLTGDSGLITLPADGTYTLEVSAAGNQGGNYAFRLVDTLQTELTLGTPYSGTLVGSGQAQLFRVSVSAGQQLRVVLDDRAGANHNELYASFGAAPTRSDFQLSAAADSADQELSVPNAVPGTWFFLVYSEAVASSGPFTLTASTADVFLTDVTPDRHGNGADMILTLAGAGFDHNTVVELVDSEGTAFPATTVSLDLPTQLTVTFAAGSVPLGNYSVRARRPDGGSAELTDAFEVVTGSQSQLETNLVLPAVIGRHSTATLYIEYANTGTVAMPAPLLVLRGTDRALMTLDKSRLIEGFWTSAVPDDFSQPDSGGVSVIQLLGFGATPGVLQPGEHVRVPVYFAGLVPPIDFGDTTADFALTAIEPDNTTTIDWSSLKDSLRSPGIPADAWEPIYANLVAQIGSTWGDFARVLADNARYLGRLGQHVCNVNQLWSFEVQQAIGFSPLPSLASSADIVVNAPGLPISFGRTFATNTIGRYEQGLLGRGWAWADSWDRVLTIEADGTVVVAGIDGRQRRFEPDSRHPDSYFSQAGDRATLTGLGDGAFLLREPNGFVTRFRGDGRIDFIADSNSNRITATYTGTLLTRLTHSAGQFLNIAYNAGRIAGLTDQAGRTVAYTYDASGEHLTTVRGIDGQTTRYSYSTGAGAAREHALLSVEYPDGTHEFFTYDTQGRVDSASKDQSAERFTFSYDTAGQVTATDALGGATEYFFDNDGLLAAVEDALGRRSVFGHDDDFQLTRVTDAMGQSSLFQYDDRGNLIRTTDPLGQVTTYNYTTDFNRLASVIDARGNPMNYGYDGRGNLTSITYANGIIERYAVDGRGELDASTNRRAQRIDYQVNTDGRLERMDVPDGTFVEYRYNSRGNVEQGIDRTGTTQLEYLDPQNPDLPTKITYPGGRFLQFTYQTGRRTRMIDQDGFTTNYSYDAAGRLEFLRDNAGSLIVQYHYDAAGRLTREDKGNGTYTEYQYDLAGQLEHLINNAPGGAVNSRFDYVYDDLGRRTRMTTPDGVWNYTYDGIGQLTRAVFTSNDPAVIPNQDLQYVYDAAGNRTRMTINGVATDYVTNNLNQYTRVGTATYTYDLDGNLISVTDGGVTTTYAYNAENRLTGVTLPGETWAYEYDAFDNRSATVHNGLRTEYLIDPFGLANAVGDYSGAGGLTAHYEQGLGLVSRVDAVGVPAYYDFDAVGSAAGLTDSTGHYVNRYRYLPFGESHTSVEMLPNPFQYVGEYGVTHEGNGLDFMRARFYSPGDGHFLSPDPLGLGGGQINYYTYAGQDPVRFSDPLGLDFVDSLLHCPTKECTEEREERAWKRYKLEQYKLSRAWLILRDCSTGLHYDKYASEDLRRLYESRPELEPQCTSDHFVICIPQWEKVTPDSDEYYLYGLDCLPLAPTPPPTPPPGPGPAASSIIETTIDPNEKTGPAGFGPEAFIAAEGAIPYRIDFENDVRATAPAQRVVVTDPLDANLDPSSFTWTEVGFGDVLVTVPPGTQHFQTTVTMTQNGRTFEVEVELSLNSNTGRLTAVFQSIDPGTSLPPDVLTGFLPPEDGTGRGQGHISYTVQPRTGLPTGTSIKNIAVITFDVNDPIATNQVDPHDPSQGTDPTKETRNTLDAGAPTSSIAPLPDQTADPDFTVQWSGSDDAGGSGIHGFDIFVSDDPGAPGFTRWLTDTKLTEAVYLGQPGHTYAFYSIARDNVGHTESPPTVPDAQTTTLLGLHVDAGGPYAILEGDALTLSAVISDGDPSDFSWDVNGDGAFGDASGQNPTLSWNDLQALGVVDGPSTFAVRVRANDDRGGEVISATTSLTVGNVVPTAVDDSAVTDEDQSVHINVLGNDLDPAGAFDPLRIESVSNGTLGSTSIDSKGTADSTDDEIVYKPNSGATGSDTFIYTIADGDGGSATAIVTVRIRNLVDVSGRVFDDKDNDGAYEPGDGDIGISGIVVQLFNEVSGALIANRTTNSDGSYFIDSNLDAGTYRIASAPPVGFLDGRETAGNLGGTVNNNQDSNQITGIRVGDPDTTLDAFDYLLARIRPSQLLGLVWRDVNNDGRVDVGETGIQAVAVQWDPLESTCRHASLSIL